MGNGMELRRPGNRRPVHKVQDPRSQQDGERQNRLGEAEKCANVDKQNYQEVMNQAVATISSSFSQTDECCCASSATCAPSYQSMYQYSMRWTLLSGFT